MAADDARTMVLKCPRHGADLVPETCPGCRVIVKKREAPAAASRPEPWEVEGSFLIERYTHTNPDGVQWLVYRVARGRLWMQLVCKTRKEAALYVAGLSN